MRRFRWDTLIMASAVAASAGGSQGAQSFPTIQVPAGYKVEKVVGGLTYATSVAWDNQGRMYVLEAGGAFVEEPVPARLMRIDNGRAVEVVNLQQKGIGASAVGLVWHDGAFYITHRDGKDRTGAVSRVTLNGQVTQLFKGIVDSQSEHQINGIEVGPDEKMYVAVGPATNAGVVGIDLGPFVARSPQVHARPCQDIVLTGRNFMTPDFRTPDQSDTVLTGAFVPFGTETKAGQVIKGTNKCGGSILTFDPKNAEATLRPFVSGLRNAIDLAWNKQGEMFVAVNGFDIRGSRGVKDQWDATYRVKQGTWYGWPDFSAALEPLTDAKFTPPGSQLAPIMQGGVMQPPKLEFLINHEASKLSAPDKNLVAGLHEWNSSPSGLHFSPDNWGPFANQLFVAEWGDLSPATNPLRDKPTGYQISRIDPNTKRAVPFARNAKPGPASGQGAMGQGLERPFDLKFNDGAMYIVDYGVARVNPARIKDGKPPYEFPPKTGVVWKITRTVP
ncbi:PQQ-dependent sugar dehydrogenase [Deinococcus peraridilitoris]|uniref:Glucose/sorbosone dehydrogenase n=1 Tax=Deinococcus peraridilitoris (strain DSM 19664 / LMG 22246 / CIP 109416 / KR-200) TaxID=937777 RepID=L0A644_DEIPD|nr:hypothetical protein [Deinococcus peraridilitoris]AFZ69321.1 hypothetical protein Deipe_3909 [Deinococcus peraridilitoris DSM 19664]